MPLAHAVGMIARAAQALAQGDVLGGDILPLARQVEQRAARIEHGAAGHAHRAQRAAGNVRAGEGGAAAHQLVHMGGLNDVVAQGVDGARALVVRQKNDHIWLFFHDDVFLQSMFRTAIHVQYTPSRPWLQGARGDCPAHFTMREKYARIAQKCAAYDRICAKHCHTVRFFI